MGIPDCEYILLCDNPQCKKSIEDDEIAYSKEYREVYHLGECINFAAGHKALNVGKAISMNVDYIKREKAIELLKSGKLSQSLEGKLD